MFDRALTFTIDGAELIGIVTTPSATAATRDGGFGVLIVVGGPQYRVGSHRQFVHLARSLAAAGIPAMRFDFAGMGDSDGVSRAFDDRSHEIGAAIDAFFAAVPGLSGIALCDGASAALFVAANDPRVKKLVLLNPWARTEEGLARTHMRHHYAKNVASLDFWKRLATGRVHVLRAVREFVATWRKSRGANESGPTLSFQERMARGWIAFRGPILLVLSGDDLTAREFEEYVAREQGWKGLVAEPRVEVRRLPEADHTFSCATWRDDVATLTVEWLQARELAHAG
jgi:uncharacterized protein